MDSASILVIEDDDIVARTIKRSLRSDEFSVSVASDGLEGLEMARQIQPALIILDVIMPGMDGYAVCRELRADSALEKTPILFLTAKIKDQDRITGFLAGADDYLSKPFNIDELVLRVRAILRRTRFVKPRPRVGQSGPGSNGEVAPKKAPEEASTPTSQPALPDYRIKVGDYILDTHTYEVFTPHVGKILLTPIQYDLLYHLMTHPGDIFSPARLLDEVWDYPTDRGSPDLVRVHIKTLRERIEVQPRSPSFIRTVPGYGYTIDTGSGQEK